MSAPKVLYITGTGRTGSTVLAQLLGRVPGWFNAGELTFLWQFGLMQGGRCSCGERLLDCKVWRPILVTAGVGDQVDPDRMTSLRRRLPASHLPLLASRQLRSRRLDALEEFPRVVDRLYRAIVEHTGARVIVDSSKEPMYSFILRERTTVDLRCLQLVRDPRAVLHSWQRDKPEIGLDGTPSMERRGPVRAAVYYAGSNAAAEMLWRRSGRYRLLRYEDFVLDPSTVLHAIGDFVGEPISEADAPPLPRFDPRPHHMAWGNPNRFRGEAVDIRADEQWRQRMGRLDRLAMTAMTTPVARRFGYRLHPRAAHAARALGRHQIVPPEVSP